MAIVKNWKGSWGGLPDLGITEWVGSKLGSGTTAQGGSNIIGKSKAAETQPAPAPAGNTNTTGTTTTTKAPVAKSSSTQPNSSAFASSDPLLDAVTSSQSSQEGAAMSAADAAKQAAMNRFEATKNAANTAKTAAKGAYDWLTETLGSNKQDLLTQVATNETQAVADYGEQEKKTTQNFDKAKQDILSTYRDLNRGQEKLLRGGNMGSSSRSLEAMTKLNASLGKDMSSISTNEADSLSVIAKAITAVKQKARDAETSIQNSTKSQLDKAALDYNTQIGQIDNTIFNSELDREDAINAAEAKLASDVASINTWANTQKVGITQQRQAQKDQLDMFVLNLLDDKKGMLSTLQQKQAEAAKFLSSIGTGVKLDSVATPTAQAGTGGNFNTGLTLASINNPEDELLQSLTGTGGTSTTSTTSTGSKYKLPQLAVNPLLQQDPLLSTLGVA